MKSKKATLMQTTQRVAKKLDRWILLGKLSRGELHEILEKRRARLSRAWNHLVDCGQRADADRIYVAYQMVAVATRAILFGPR